MSPSESIREAVHAAAEALEAAGARYALCGGAALPSWGHERGTRDADFIVAIGDPVDETLDRVVQEARVRGFAHHSRADRKRLDDCEVLHFWFPLRTIGLSIRVDAIVRGPRFHREVVERAVQGTVFGRSMPVSTCEDMILLKLLAERPIDVADARALYEINEETLDRAALESRARSLGLEGRLAGIASRA